MVKINTIILLKTPFHQKTIEFLFPQFLNNTDTLLLYNAALKIDNYNCHKQELKEYNFSREKIFSNPLKFYIPFRRHIKSINNDINFLESKYLISSKTECYLGSDKDIFTQVFLNKIKSKLTKVVAVDEGLGFYIRLTEKDHIISILYRLLTPILFGKRLFYVKRLGTIPLVDTVYLRKLELLPTKVSSINYKEFQLKNSQIVKPIEDGEILFFSVPEMGSLYSSEKKIELQLAIATYIDKFDRKLIIKPHPREDIVYLRMHLKHQKNIKIIDAQALGESLQYFQYEYIINIFSSIIIDVIDSAYPMQRLLTLGYNKEPEMQFNDTLKYIPIDEFKIEEYLMF